MPPRINEILFTVGISYDLPANKVVTPRSFVSISIFGLHGVYSACELLNSPESNYSRFRREQRRFRQLCLEALARHNPGPRIETASPKRVLAFVEGLLLCRTEAEALILIEGDQEAAEFIRTRSGDVAHAADAQRSLNAKEVSIREGPFCFVAEMLLKRCRLAAEELDEHWQKEDETDAFGM